MSKPTKRFGWLHYHGRLFSFAFWETVGMFWQRPKEVIVPLLVYTVGVVLMTQVFSATRILDREMPTTGLWLISAITVFLVLFFFNLFLRSPYALDREREAVISALQGALHSQTVTSTPQLEISYDDTDDHRDVVGDTLVHRVVRLRLHNPSEAAIEGIQVKAKQFDLVGRAVLKGTPLRIAHDRENTKMGGFTMNPGSTEWVDIVERVITEGVVHLCDVLPERHVTNRQEFIVEVEVTANNMPHQEKTLLISQVEAELLHCEVI